MQIKDMHGATIEIVSIPKLNVSDEQRARLMHWADELDSGTYKQGQSFLRVNKKEGPTFCCLGVASDLSKLGEWTRRGAGGNYYHIKETSDTTFGTLSRPVKDFYGLESVNGFRTKVIETTRGEPEEIERTLDWLNDVGVPFTEISKLIRLAATTGYLAA